MELRKQEKSIPKNNNFRKSKENYGEEYYSTSRYGFETLDREDHRRILELINFKGKKVLDLGCGYGSLLRLIPTKKQYKYGLESNQHAVGVCRQYGLNVKRHRKLEKLLFPDNYFEVVVMNEVIEHLREILPVLNEVKRILKPKGYFVITTPNKSIFVKNLHETHYSELTYKELEEMVTQPGFQILNHEVSGFGPYDLLGRKIIFPVGKLLLKRNILRASVEVTRSGIDHSRISKFRTNFVWLGAQQLMIAVK